MAQHRLGDRARSVQLVLRSVGVCERILNMSNYITCEGCQRLIDLYPPPQRSNQQMWPSPTIFDTTVTIDSGRFCAECGKSRLLGKDIVKGYRVDDGSVLSRGLQPYFSA